MNKLILAGVPPRKRGVGVPAALAPSRSVACGDCAFAHALGRLTHPDGRDAAAFAQDPVISSTGSK